MGIAFTYVTSDCAVLSTYQGACRLAQELNLGNVNPEPGMSEREHLNRIRTWLNCYCVDWSHATQFGKPAMISVDDFTARSCREWYRSSRCNLAIDVHLVAYVEMLRTMGHFKREMARPGLRIVRAPSSIPILWLIYEHLLGGDFTNDLSILRQIGSAFERVVCAIRRAP